MSRDDLEAWLAAYGRAWRSKDAEAFAALFSRDVRYHWTPFEEPKRGRQEVAEAFGAAVRRQERIEFGSSVLSVDAREGVAHWWCSFDRVETRRRVRLDGIFRIELDEAGLCSVFREWWHSDEAADAPVPPAPPRSAP